MRSFDLGAAEVASASRWRLLLAYATIYLVFGGNFVALRALVSGHAPPLLSSSVRFLVAGALIILVSASRHRPISLGVRDHGSAAVTGFLVLSIGSGALTLGERAVSAGVAALVMASVPLWVVILRRIVGRQRTARAALVSVVLGLVGLALVLFPENRSANAQAVAFLLVMTAATASAVGEYGSSRLPMRTDLLTWTGWQMVWAGALLLPSAIALGEFRTLSVSGVTVNAWLALAYMTLASSCLAFTVLIWLLRREPIARVATYAYVNPIVAILLAWLLLHEQLETRSAFGALIVVGSVGVTLLLDGRTHASAGDTAQPVRDIYTTPSGYPSCTCASLSGPAVVELPSDETC